MKKVTITALFAAMIFIGAGCTSIQENYKPLYQAKPQKQAIEPKAK